MIAAAEVRPPRQVSARRVYPLPWNTTSTPAAATNAEYFYDCAVEEVVVCTDSGVWLRRESVVRTPTARRPRQLRC